MNRLSLPYPETVTYESQMSEPHSSIDDIIELYKKDVDRTLIRENLKLTTTERLQQLENAQRFVEELRKNRRDRR